MAAVSAPHLPQQAPIDAYGKGGFRFAGMSHRGSLLSLPGGMWAWPVASKTGITAESLSAALEKAADLDFLLLGGGADPWVVPQELRQIFSEHRLSLDAMTTGTAVRTYNILLGEGRRVAAAFIAVD